MPAIRHSIIMYCSHFVEDRENPKTFGSRSKKFLMLLLYSSSSAFSLMVFSKS